MGCSAQEWLEEARSQVDLLSREANCAEFFVGRWRIVKFRLEKLSSTLEQISENLESGGTLLVEILQAIVESCHNAEVLAEECRRIGSGGGKLMMQSKLDASAGRLQQHIRDCELLLKNRQALGVKIAVSGVNREILRCSVRDLVTRLQVPRSRQQALDAIVDLLDRDEKNVPLVAAQGGVAALVHLLDAGSPGCIREKAAAAVRRLSRICEAELVAEGAVERLSRLLSSGSAAAKESAAAALEELSFTPESARAMAANGGGGGAAAMILSGGTPSAMAAAAGCLRNLAAAGEIPSAADEAYVLSALSLILGIGTASAQESAIAAIYTLATSDRCILSRHRTAVDAVVQFATTAPPGKAQEMAMAAIAIAAANDGVNAGKTKLVAAKKRVSLAAALAALAQRKAAAPFSSWLKKLTLDPTGSKSSSSSSSSSVKKSIIFFSRSR